jgi:hypothetical protein
MATEERPARTWNTGSLSLALVFLLIALLCFVAGFCLAEGWLTKGTIWEWAFAGFTASTLAKIL